MTSRYTIGGAVGLIDRPNQDACVRILLDNWLLFARTPGSTHNHQAWFGGYIDHITEVMNIAVALYAAMSAQRPLPFSLSDALLVVFLHDLEKPWKYEVGPDGQLQHNAQMQTKADHQQFRLAMVGRYGIKLTEEQLNGVAYAEGEIGNYSNRERRMGPLAAFAHMCDVASARIWYDHPLATNDPWIGAARAVLP